MHKLLTLFVKCYTEEDAEEQSEAEDEDEQESEEDKDDVADNEPPKKGHKRKAEGETKGW